MVFEHDFVRFPELTNKQLQEHIQSPHPQITADIMVEVVKVIDGDTIRVKWKRREFDFPVRFLGINAPEMSEGGQESQRYLKGVIEGEIVILKIDKNQRVGKYGRLLARVMSRGLDMGEMMIRLGLATNFESRNQGKIPNINKEIMLSKWF